jgi:hypothetical protein
MGLKMALRIEGLKKNLSIFHFEQVNKGYGNMGYQVFKWGIQNWKDFCLEINIPKGND